MALHSAASRSVGGREAPVATLQCQREVAVVSVGVANQPTVDFQQAQGAGVVFRQQGRPVAVYAHGGETPIPESQRVIDT